MRTRCAAALAAGLLAAGCGGSSSPSLAQLRAQANRICSVTDRRAVRVAHSSTAAHPEVFLRHGILALGTEYRQLKRLSARGDAAPVYSSGLDALSGEMSAIAHTITALEHQQDPVIAFRALEARLSPLERQANSAWSSLGISACAS